MTARPDGPRKRRAHSGAATPWPGREHCANCGITIDDDDEEREPTGGGGSRSLDLGAGAAFCCGGCADGGPCTC